MIDPGLMDMIMRLRGRGVSDIAILRAFETIPRKHFVARELYYDAYDEKRLPIECGQILPEPLVIARMLQVLETSPDHKVLEIGTGSGYQAALLSKLCKRVYSVERYKQLVKISEERFQKLELTNIVVRHGDGRFGWKGQAPFDRILISTGLRTIPEGLIEQLSSKGRIVAVVDGELIRLDKSRGRVKETSIVPMTLPMIEAGKSKAL